MTKSSKMTFVTFDEKRLNEGNSYMKLVTLPDKVPCQ